MLVKGTGINRVALLTVHTTPTEKAAEDPLRSLRALWTAPRPSLGEQRDDFLRISYTAKQDDARVLEVLHKRNIAVVMPVDVTAKALVAPHFPGNPRKLIGTMIPGGTWTTMPLMSAKHGGERAFRDYIWNVVQAKFIRRAVDHARSSLTPWTPPSISQGNTLASLEALRRIQAHKGPIGVDLETAGINKDSPITAFGLSSASEAVSVPWHAYHSKLYDFQPALVNRPLGPEIDACVREILIDPYRQFVFHNGAFDLSVLRAFGVPISGKFEDTILAHRVCFPALYHNLQFCMAHAAPVDPWKTRFDLERAAANEPKDDWAEVEPINLTRYNAGDAAAEQPLWAWLSERLSASDELVHQYEVMKELAVFSAEVKWHGVRVDSNAVLDLDTALCKRLGELEAEWAALTDGVPSAGSGSDAALKALFTDTLAAPFFQRTRKGAISLSSSALLDWDAPTQPNDKLADVAFLLFRLRKARKAQQGFIKPMLGLTRVFPELNFGGTKGTRASCKKPNLQQWSKEKESFRPRTGKKVKLAPPLRKLLVPDEGHVMWEFDANALELRLVAYAAGIPIWLHWMANDIDMHIEHVALMFGVRVTKKNDPDNLREVTKTLTYARFYNDRETVGQVLKNLKSKMPTLTEEKLITVFKLLNKARPEIRDWQLERQEFVKKHGFVETGMGGWRQYHDKKFPDLNAAYSFSIQSTGGAFMNQGMLRLDRLLDKARGSRTLFQVHDSLVGQSRPEFLAEDMALVKREMEEPVKLWKHESVIIPFEGKYGPNLADMVPYKN